MLAIYAAVWPRPIGHTPRQHPARYLRRPWLQLLLRVETDRAPELQSLARGTPDRTPELQSLAR